MASERREAHYKRTSFSVDLEVTHEIKGSPQFVGQFTDVPLVDVVKSEFDGKQILVGMLCIPVQIRMVEIQYASSPWGMCFQDLSRKMKAGVRVQYM